MSTPEAGQQLPAETVARRANVARMLSWVGVDAMRLEAARVVLGPRSLRATGSLVAAPQEGADPYGASYSLATDETGMAQRLTVRTIRVQGEQHVTLTRSEEGIWLIDHGGGVARTDFGGALDVNLAFSPLFNALPVRRLGLHHTAAQHRLPTVFVSLPHLDVQLIRQSYRTISLGDPAVVSYTSDSFDEELIVDADGLVLDFPGLAQRA